MTKIGELRVFLGWDSPLLKQKVGPVEEVGSHVPGEFCTTSFWITPIPRDSQVTELRFRLARETADDNLYEFAGLPCDIRGVCTNEKSI